MIIVNKGGFVFLCNNKQAYLVTKLPVKNIVLVY